MHAGLDVEMRKFTYNNNSYYILVNSMAALGAMIFSAPTSLLVQPRNVFGGHIIAGTTGVVLDYAVIQDKGLPLWVAIAIAPACTVFMMAKLGLIHPPAVATCVIYLNDINRFRSQGFLFIVAPLLMDCVVSVLFQRFLFEKSVLFRCGSVACRLHCVIVDCLNAVIALQTSVRCGCQTAR